MDKQLPVAWHSVNRNLGRLACFLTALAMILIFTSGSPRFAKQTPIGRRIAVSISQTYTNAPKAHVDIESKVREVLECFGFDVVDDSCRDCSARLNITMEGTALGNNYERKWYWTAARVKGEIRLTFSGKALYKKTFTRQTAGLRSVSEIKTDRSTYATASPNPEGAPFEDALLESQFYVSLLEIADRFTVKKTLYHDFSVKFPISCVGISANGVFVAVGFASGRLMLYNIKDGREIAFKQTNSKFIRLIVSNDGNFAATNDGFSDSTQIILWDLHKGKRIRNYPGHRSKITCFAFSQNDSLMLSGCEDGSLKFWDARKGTLLRSLTGHEGSVLSASFSHDGRLALSTGGDGSVKVWETETGKELRTFLRNDGLRREAAFSPDDTEIIACDYRGTIEAWKIDTGEKVLAVKIGEPSNDYFTHIAFSPDRSRVSVVMDGTKLQIWDIGKNRIERSFPVTYLRGMRFVEFLPGGRNLVSCNRIGVFKFFDVSE